MLAATGMGIISRGRQDGVVWVPLVIRRGARKLALDSMNRRVASFRLDFPPELPISARVEDITLAIQQHPVLVLSGETGSGKTTQIPKMCLAAGRGTAGRIACTQPRRVAALSISRRVAEELGVPWGREVGCKVRFSDHTSPSTIIKYLTDGMLLAELQGDPLLREYDTIIIDEAHERSLNIDFLLGHLRQLRFRRPELRTIITSATIDTQAFSRAFDDAPIIEVSGRLYPVEVIYAPLDEFGSDAAADDEPAARSEALHYIDGAVAAVERILRESSSGDILVFMPAERDIRETRDLIDGPAIRPHRGHSAVRPPEQRRAAARFCPDPAAQDHHRHQHCRDLAHDSRASASWSTPGWRASAAIRRRRAPGACRSSRSRKAAPTSARAGAAAWPKASASGSIPKRTTSSGRVSPSPRSSAPTWPTSSCG